VKKFKKVLIPGLQIESHPITTPCHGVFFIDLELRDTDTVVMVGYLKQFQVMIMDG
jgi:hypothetical protein